MAVVVVKTGPFRVRYKSLAVNIGKSVSKKATERNLLKRRVRAIAQPLIKNKNRKIIIIIKPEALKKSFSELKAEINKEIKEII
mgnify:CR=1 FL=1